MDSQFSLRWSNYNDQIKDAFGSLLQEEDLVDVTLSCEGKKIKAHKMLLSACSPYFRDVFKDNPCQHPVIVFRNVTFADLKAIVEFVYCGEVTVSQDQIESFLNTAELLEIKGLSEKENEIDPIETVEISRDGESEQIDPIKEMPKKLLSRKQESHAAESSGRCSPPTKRKKSHKEESRVASPVVVISGEEPILVKEEALEIIDEPVVTDPLADSSLEPNPSSQEGLAENQGQVLKEPSVEVAVEKQEIPSSAPSEDKITTHQEVSSTDVEHIETKSASVPLKKRKTISEDQTLAVVPEKKTSEAKSKSMTAKVAVQPPVVQTPKGKLQIPKGLTVVPTVAAFKVQTLFDFPAQEREANQGESSVPLSSEDATTPVHEQLISTSEISPVCEDIPSGEPEIAEEAPNLQEGLVEPEVPTEEEPVEPEFDYYGCEICKNEAKPVDLDRLVFSHKCPICPCACFCSHLLKEHMRIIHGWFNVQRRFTQY